MNQFQPSSIATCAAVTAAAETWTTCRKIKISAHSFLFYRLTPFPPVSPEVKAPSGRPLSWVQAGLFKKREPKPTDSITEQEVITAEYTEIIFDSAHIWDQTINHRIFNNRGTGDVKWVKGKAFAEIDSELQQLKGGWNGKSISHKKIPSGKSIGDFAYNLLQVAYETTASVSRICGTPSSKGSVSNIRVRTPGSQLKSPKFETLDFEISLYSPTPNGPRNTVTSPTLGDEIKLLHYRLKGAPDSFQIWDEYDWLKQPEKW